ncbi:hypothetical protein Ciccas_008875 [Cichlidogyrus casuarinus]|uniref:Uncharacterized protein n=1 Tax=Cichlidogyrus casuarinus TaxID=1844966 RepID=A0ABD2Q024_9PLAT
MNQHEYLHWAAHSSRLKAFLVGAPSSTKTRKFYSAETTQSSEVQLSSQKNYHNESNPDALFQPAENENQVCFCTPYPIITLQ